MTTFYISYEGGRGSKMSKKKSHVVYGCAPVMRSPSSFYRAFYSISLALGAKSEWAASIKRTKITIRKMCKMQWWFWTVITMVFLNTCTVAVEHYNQPQWLTEFLCKFF